LIIPFCKEERGDRSCPTPRLDHFTRILHAAQTVLFKYLCDITKQIAPAVLFCGEPEPWEKSSLSALTMSGIRAFGEVNITDINVPRGIYERGLSCLCNV